MVKRAADGSEKEAEERVTKLRKIDAASRGNRFHRSRSWKHLEHIPDELLLRILSFLDLGDLIHVQRSVIPEASVMNRLILNSVSRRISILAKDSQLWKQLYYERFVYRRFGRLMKGYTRDMKVGKSSLITSPLDKIGRAHV